MKPSNQRKFRSKKLENDKLRRFFLILKMSVRNDKQLRHFEDLQRVTSVHVRMMSSQKEKIKPYQANELTSFSHIKDW